MIFDLSFDQFLMLLFGYVTLMIVLFILMKIRGKGKLPCLVLKPSKFYSVHKKKADGTKIKFKDWPTETKFGVGDIFTEEKPAWKFWRLPKQLLIVGYKAKEALTWKKGETKLESVWSDRERQEIVAKEVAKARTKGSIISNTWAIIIIMILLALCFMVFWGFNRIGVF